MIETRIIDAAHKEDIYIPNEPFKLFGRMVPAYNKGCWSYEVEKFGEKDITEMCFPDENYDYDAMKENSVFVGAYDGDICVGLAIMQNDWFKYMYLYDLKVNAAYRGTGAVQALIQKCCEVSRAGGYNGIYTQGQDDNLGACLFYLKSGFRIGGLNTDVYKGTAQEGKADIYFYLDC